MSTVLRTSGSDFDVEAYIKDCPLKIIVSFRKGEPRSKNSKRLRELSGLNIEVSNADFDDLAKQMADTQAFLTTHEAELTRLRDFPGVEFISIDFGVDIYPPGWCSFCFPHELLRLAGTLRIDLELSVYPSDPEEEPDSPPPATGPDFQ